MSRRRGPATFSEPLESGSAQLVEDLDRPGCWTVLIDGTPQSHVDLTDPTSLRFEYIRWLASVIDTASEEGAPLRILHLGGGGLTFPRYVAATRPGSVQRVVERDAALIDLVRRALPLPRNSNIRIRAHDGRAAVEQARDSSFDVVVTDVFSGARVPGRFTTVEFAEEVARVLRPTGCYLVNLADGPPLEYSRRQVSTHLKAFSEVCLIAEASVLRGRRFGNIVLAAAPRSGTLPVEELATATARDLYPARVITNDRLERFRGTFRPVTDSDMIESPLPPASLF